MQSVPVITVDGPSGVGKGTISQLLAKRLQWHWLDSGAIYRVLALAARQYGIELTDSPELINLAKHLAVEFVADGVSGNAQVLLEGKDVTHAIRSEQCSQDASKVAAVPHIRQALLERQRGFCQPPGLVTDGRDMGTVVFPEAQLKFFLQASPEIRAERRFKQLQEKGNSANLADILHEMQVRDQRDSERSAAPLKPAEDAIVIDTSHLSVNEVLERVWAFVSRLLAQPLSFVQ